MMPETEIKVFEPDQIFHIKPPCPYCGGKLTCTTSAWEQESDGQWVATEIQMDCHNEPDIDSDGWWEWCHNHGEDDYAEAWHLLIERLLRQMKQRFRFKL